MKISNLISKIKNYRESRRLYLLDLKRARLARRFFDVDIDKNYYLGQTKIAISEQYANVYFFCDKTDFTKRFYIIKTSSIFYKDMLENHPWLGQAELWKIGEHDIYQPVLTNPGSFLNEYMLNRFRAVWDPETKWWKTTEPAKYQSAVSNQKKEFQESVDNIVKFEPKKER